MNKKLELTIGWLYPVLMSTYGDRGNIITLQKRIQWRGIDIKIKELNEEFPLSELKDCDLLFMGGAQDRQQKVVSTDLSGKKADTLANMIDDGVPGLYICGAYQFLGKYYKEADGTKLSGLGILDVHTEHPGTDSERLIGNIIVEQEFLPGEKTLVGFENHGGRTYLGKNVKPMATVTIGFGNNGEDNTEGATYKNSFGSYMHGPILPKNPHFADFLIQKGIERKYGEVVLKELDNDIEWKAHEYVIKRFG